MSSWLLECCTSACIHRRAVVSRALYLARSRAEEASGRGKRRGVAAGELGAEPRRAMLGRPEPGQLENLGRRAQGAAAVGRPKIGGRRPRS
jgi:hypothetical protein